MVIPMAMRNPPPGGDAGVVVPHHARHGRHRRAGALHRLRPGHGQGAEGPDLSQLGWENHAKIRGKQRFTLS